MRGPNPSELDSHLGYWLRKLSNRVSLEFAQSLSARGVSVAEWVALRHLYDHSPLAPSSLAEVMGMTQGAISKIVDKLLAKEWIETLENEADRRGRFLMLTDAGRQSLPELAAIADHNDERFFGALSSEERILFRRLMEHLCNVHGLDEFPIT